MKHLFLSVALILIVSVTQAQNTPLEEEICDVFLAVKETKFFEGDSILLPKFTVFVDQENRMYVFSQKYGKGQLILRRSAPPEEGEEGEQYWETFLPMTDPRNVYYRFIRIDDPDIFITRLQKAIKKMRVRDGESGRKYFPEKGSSEKNKSNAKF